MRIKRDFNPLPVFMAINVLISSTKCDYIVVVCRESKEFTACIYGVIVCFFFVIFYLDQPKMKFLCMCSVI